MHSVVEVTDVLLGTEFDLHFHSLMAVSGSLKPMTSDIGCRLRLVGDPAQHKTRWSLMSTEAFNSFCDKGTVPVSVYQFWMKGARYESEFNGVPSSWEIEDQNYFLVRLS